MRMHKPATVLPLRIAQVPLPAYPVLGNIKPGGVLLSGKLASAVDTLKLDTRDMPPSRFKSVRDDISRYSPIPVTRVALRRSEHAYIGIIDSNNEPYIFALNSQGILVKRAPDAEHAWQLFDHYMDAERATALETRRYVAAKEQASLVIKADIKQPGSRGGKFYFDKHGKVRYGKQPMHDHHVHVELPAKHELEGDAAELHKHVRKQNPATVHEARKHIRSWIKDNYSANAKQIDQTTAHMLRYFHEEGALHLHQHDTQPTAQPTKDVPHFFKKREALTRPVLPSPFDAQGTRLLVNGSPVRLSADAEHACYAFAKRFLVNEGTVKGHAEFVRGFEKSLQSMGVPKGTYDYKNFVKRITTEPEKEKAPKSKEQPTPKTHPHLFIKQDGQFVRLSDVRTPAGNFYTGKGKRGTWARALREEDITMNVANGGAPKGWKGKVIFDPTKDYYLTWRHPDTDEIGYVYPSRASAYQRKFEEASKLGLNIDRIREGVVRDIEKSGNSMPERVAALCTYLIDKEHFRVGEESHAEDTGTFGIGSLRVEHVKVDGKHVIFDFPGKKDEPWRRVVDFSKMPEALHIIKSCLAHKHKKDRVWEELGGGWSVDSKVINEYLDGYSKDGVKFTAKMFRTFHANKYMKKMLDTLETLAAEHGWDDATVKKIYKGFKVNDRAGKKLLDMKAPGGGTVRQALGLEENHGAKGKGKAIIGVLPTIATKLGHTVSSCRNSYIDPVLVTPFGAKHGWDERTLGEKKTRDDLPAFEKKHVAKPAKQPKAPASPMKKAGIPSHQELAKASEKLLTKVTQKHADLAPMIDSYKETAIKRRWNVPAEACGNCDRATGEFVSQAPASAGLKKYRFDTFTPEGIARVQKLYGMSDKTIAEMRKRDRKSIKDGHADPEDMFHEVAVTPDGTVIDWTANQFAQSDKTLPVPFVYKIDHTKNSKPHSGIEDEEAYAKALPYGHVAYARHSKTGKLVQVKAKGVKPVQMNTQAPFLVHPDQQPFHPKKNEKDYKVWRTVHDAKPQTYDETVRAIHGAIKHHFGADDEELTDSVVDHFQEEGAMHAPDHEPEDSVDEDDDHIKRDYLKIDHGKYATDIANARSAAHGAVLSAARNAVYEAHGAHLFTAYTERLFRDRKETPYGGFKIDEGVHQLADQAQANVQEEAQRAGDEAERQAGEHADQDIADRRHANEMLRQGLVTFEHIDPTPAEHALERMNDALPKVITQISNAIKQVAPALASFYDVENKFEDEPEHEDVTFERSDVSDPETDLSEILDFMSNYGGDDAVTSDDLEPESVDLPELPDEPSFDGDDEEDAEDDETYQAELAAYNGVIKQRAATLNAARLKYAEQAVTGLSKLETVLKNATATLKARGKEATAAREKLEKDFDEKTGDGSFDDDLVFMNQKEFPQVAKEMNPEEEEDEEIADEGEGDEGDEEEEPQEDARYDDARRAAQTLRDHVRSIIDGDFESAYDGEEVTTGLESAVEQVRTLRKEYASVIKKLSKKKGKVSKAVPIIQRPGVRGGHFHFNTKGKVVYERHITYNAPARSWRGFDDLAFRRVMDEHKHVEVAHKKHVKRLADEMKTLRAKKQIVPKHRRAALQLKINKLRAQQLDHRMVVAAAREQRLRVNKQRAVAKQKFVATQRLASKKKQTATARKRKREMIMPIGVGMGIGTHTIREKPVKPKVKTLERMVYRKDVETDPPVKEAPKVEPAPEQEPKKEPQTAQERAAAASAAKWDPQSRSWVVNGKPMVTPASEKYREAPREVVSYKQKTYEEQVAEEQRKRAYFDASAKRARAKYEALRAAKEAEVVHQKEHAPPPVEEKEAQGMKKRGVLSKLGGLFRRKKDTGTITASFVDSHNIFKVSYL